MLPCPADQINHNSPDLFSDAAGGGEVMEEMGIAKASGKLRAEIMGGPKDEGMGMFGRSLQS